MAQPPNANPPAPPVAAEPPERNLLRLAIAVVALFLFGVLLCDVGHVTDVAPPPLAAVAVTPLDQHWSPQAAQWFHHASQGTMIMPLDWFTALEQPDVRLASCPGVISDPQYLRRFGFLCDDDDEQTSLPIGFAVAEDFRDPHMAASDPDAAHFQRVVGLTCAACHTAQINYGGQGIRIEGGPGNVDFGLFQKAVGRALALTLYMPTRFDRFAHRVLGDRYDAANLASLRGAFRRFVESKLHEQLYADRQHLYDMKAGNGRTDALALIGNRTFHDLNNPENLAVTDAPVNFPPLWDTAWFDWVQYNGSIKPPMVRNIGEALGVGALVVIDPALENPFDSTVDVENLHKIESQLAGPGDAGRSARSRLAGGNAHTHR